MIFYFPYGGTGTIYFPLQGSATAALTVLASGSLNGTTIKWSIDGGAYANSTNTGTVVGSGVYLLALTAGETTGKVGVVNIKSSNGIFEDQVVIYQTYGNAAAALPFNLGTNEVILKASQATATIGTVIFLASGTVNTVLNSVTSTVIGTPAVDAVALKGTAIAGTQGTIFANLVPNQSTATIGTVTFLASGTVNTVLGTVAATVASLTANRGELAGIPSPTTDIGTKIDFMYMVTINALVQGSGATSTLTLRNNADTGAIGTRTVVDDGTTLKSGKWQ